jgi:O-methyltransferase involved in polyketide biosynthesis
LAARARETARKRPVLHDPKAAELVAAIDFDVKKYGTGAGGLITVLRADIYDTWVRAFLADHPHGTVVDIGTGLNTRFDRVDNGTVRWFDLDLPDTIELRREFFTDTDRRRMIAASVLDTDWLDTVADSPGPYCFVAEGVLVYLPEADVRRTLSGIAERFPGALLAFDTYARRLVDGQHRMADRKGIARWSWAVEDPHDLAGIGLTVVRTAALTDPPPEVRAHLPARYRLPLPLVNKVLGRLADITEFRAEPSAAR